MTPREKLNDGLAALVVGVAMIPVVALARGWALATLWRWFVVPLGVPAIGWAQAFGLSTLLGLATFKVAEAQRNGEKPEGMSRLTWTLTLTAGGVGAALLSVGFGWVIARCM